MILFFLYFDFFFSSRRRHTRCALVTGVQTCALPIYGNFHGRTTTIVGFSDDPTARDDFGPYAPGFIRVPFGDAAAIEAAIDENTAAVLIEPIQGEGVVIIPPEGYLRAVREMTTKNNVLFIVDELQSGRSEEHTSELQSLMRISYAVFCLKNTN